MLDLQQVDRIVEQAASAALKESEVIRVFSSPGTAFDGSEILDVTIVLRDFEVKREGGDSPLDAIVRIQQDLQKKGDDRFAVVRFVTEADLQANDDP